MRRVVVTGVGIVSSLGLSQEAVKQALLDGRSGLSASSEYRERGPRRHLRRRPDIALQEHITPQHLRTTAASSTHE